MPHIDTWFNPWRCRVAAAWEQPGCTPPRINESSLEHHRCQILTDLCIDQVPYAPPLLHLLPSSYETPRRMMGYQSRSRPADELG